MVETAANPDQTTTPPANPLSENIASITTPDFGLANIGLLLSASSVIKDLLNDKPVTEIKIPPQLQQQAARAIIAQSGAATLGEFLTSDAIMPKVIEGIHTDLQEHAADPQNTIIFKFLAEMDGAQLKAMLGSSPKMKEFLKEELQPTIQQYKEDQIAKTTIDDVLKASDVPEANYPASLKGLLVSDLVVDKLTELNDQDLLTVMAAMPYDQLQATLTKIASQAEFPSDRIPAISSDASFEIKLSAINILFDNIAQDKANFKNSEFSLWDPNSYKAMFTAAVANEANIKTEIFKGIRTSFTKDQDNNGIADGQDYIAAIQQGVRNKADEMVAKFDVNTMSDEEVKALFDKNKDQIAAKLVDEKNWDMIQSLITKERIKENDQIILREMLPEMTTQGLQSFKEMLDQLPPQFKQIIAGFLEFLGPLIDKAVGFAKQFGIDLNPQTAQATPANTPVPEQQHAAAL